MNQGIHIQGSFTYNFLLGLTGCFFNCSTLLKPSFRSTSFQFEHAVTSLCMSLASHAVAADSGLAGKGNSCFWWMRGEMKIILWHLCQAENTTENIAQCTVLCNVCFVPCALLRLLDPMPAMCR